MSALELLSTQAPANVLPLKPFSYMNRAELHRAEQVPQIHPTLTFMHSSEHKYRQAAKTLDRLEGEPVHKIYNMVRDPHTLYLFAHRNPAYIEEVDTLIDFGDFDDFGATVWKYE